MLSVFIPVLVLVTVTSAAVFLHPAAIRAFIQVHNQLRKNTAPCLDSRWSCANWASGGECERNPRWMLPNCQKSCKQCPCEPDCKDTNGSCPYWADNGYCTRYSAWMKTNCKLSCGGCLCGANMPLLYWSNELANYAAARVDKCEYKHDPAKKYGENLYMMYYHFLDADVAATTASQAWGDEIQYVTPDWACAYGPKTKETCGHYSQQVWNTTTQVGCAVGHCYGGGPYPRGTYVFCEYTPKGNLIINDLTGKKIYVPPY
ncbi:venom allergen 5 [Aplysia californica]|uniref:Venom allergen 5 n=1 Tax=Aplysia californica TaxID=6500 RepID=A0ABM0ZVS2_APLCA|nr:venom allergen 5 [Aplysia californica]